MPEPDSRAQRALDNLDRAFDEATEAITGHPDAKEAFDYATALGERVERQWRARVALLRAQMARRVRDALQLTLSGLAAVTGVSKARAKQWTDQSSGREDQR